MKTKVTYIISHVNKALAFEWIADFIDKQKIELSFILLNKRDTDLEKYLVAGGFKVKQIDYKNKYDIPKAFIQTLFFLLRHKQDIVHTHLFDANIVGLTAAWFCGVKKRIHTRHHSNYHHASHPKAVKYDKFCNSISTTIIAISNLVKEILEQKEGVPKNKIILIQHGFKLDRFDDVPNHEISELRQRYETQGFYPVVGVISRYTEWKGIQYIIPAFEKLLIEFPNAKLILANAEGSYKIVKELLKTIPSKNYIEIEFENNLFALYKLFDVFIHAPVDEYCEAYGQIYVESLAASIPSIFTISGIAQDFIKDRHNALVVNYRSSRALYEAIKEIITDTDLTNKLVLNGKNDVWQLFPVSKMISELEFLYLKDDHAK